MFKQTVTLGHKVHPPPSRTRNPHLECRLPSSRPLLCHWGGWGKNNQNAHKTLMFQWLLYWFSIHLVAVNLWLSSRVPINLILTVFPSVFSVSGEGLTPRIPHSIIFTNITHFFEWHFQVYLSPYVNLNLIVCPFSERNNKSQKTELEISLAFINLQKSIKWFISYMQSQNLFVHIIFAN